MRHRVAPGLLASALVAGVVAASGAEPFRALRQEPAETARLRREILALHRGGWSARESAALRLLALGARARPALRDELRQAGAVAQPGYAALVGAVLQLGGLSSPALDPEWFVDLDAADPEVSRCAVNVLGLAGPEVVPKLVQALDAPSAPRREAALDALALHGAEARDARPLVCRRLLEDDSEGVRWRAARALGNLVPDAASLAALRQGLADRDADVRLACAWALSRAGEAGIEGLVQALDAPPLREHASGWLHGLGAPAARRLLELGVHSNPGALALAARILGAEERGEPEVLRWLESFAGFPDEQVRAEVVQALARCAPDSEAALQATRNALRGPGDTLRLAGGRAFWMLGPGREGLSLEALDAWRFSWKSPERAQDFVACLCGKLAPSPEVCEKIVAVMAAAPKGSPTGAQGGVLLQSLGAPALATVRARLADADAELACALASTLVDLPGGLEPLLELSRSPTKRVRLAALALLGLPASEDERVLARLAEGLGDAEERERALFALEWQGASASALLRKALRTFDTLQPVEKIHLVRALGKFDADAPGFVEKIAPLASRPGPTELRLACIGALGNGKRAMEARVKALLAVLALARDAADVPGRGAERAQEATQDCALAAMVALEQLAPPGATAPAALAELLSHPAVVVRVFAAETLGKLGRTAAGQLEALARNVSGPTEAPAVFAAFSATRAIVRIGAEPALTAALADALFRLGPPRSSLSAQALAEMDASSPLLLPAFAYAALHEDFEPLGWSYVEEPKGSKVRWTVKAQEECWRKTRTLACELLARQARTFPEQADLVRRVLGRVRDLGLDSLSARSAELLAELEGR